MESYKKVVVFTPMEILEKVSYQPNELHDDLLEEMFESRVWENYEMQMQSKDFLDNEIYQHLLHTRASFLAYEVGFSVCYETESHVMFYISDFVTNDMIQYIIDNYQDERDYLSFSTFLSGEDVRSQYYEVETNEQKSYSMVNQELLQVLYIKKALQETKRGR